MASVEWVGAAAGNYSTAKAAKIGVMPHWIVGTLDSCIRTFQSSGRCATTQYGTSATRKVQFVDEDMTSYHCGNSYYNGALISIEQEGWIGNPPNDACLQNTAEIMADVSKRRGFGKYSLGDNVLLHSWVYATACPGETDIPLLIAKANAILDPKPVAWDGPTKNFAGNTAYDTCAIIAAAANPKGEHIVEARSSDPYDMACAMWVAGKAKARMHYIPNRVLAFDGIMCAGANRFGTNRVFNNYMSKVLGYDTGDTCLIVRADNASNFADIVAAAHVSYTQGIPIILYEDHENFYEQIAQFEKRIVIGGTSAVPKLVAETERIAGNTKYDTAIAVTERFSKTWNWLNIATGNSFHDGLAAAQMTGGAAFLFAESAETIAAIKKHKSEINNIAWFGGLGAVSYERRVEICKAAGLM